MGAILEQIRLGVVHDQELHAVRLINQRNIVVYDVGANRGQSIVSFKLIPVDGDSDSRGFVSAADLVR
ncbi:hypothetical protein [Methylobacterium durans]|uniref:hypothetical protein n=1 Tax=Methylobacterium durans TaxID=2202825 RepID=UPI0013A5AF47|nr:hypothetical protein [Methylobacterium durans]